MIFYFGINDDSGVGCMLGLLVILEIVAKMVTSESQTKL